MPRRRDKRTDTENSDEYQQNEYMDRVTHFGPVQFNRLLAPDKIEGDDVSKYSILSWSNSLNAQRLLPWPERKQLFQRALECLPYSFKIWHMYLQEYMQYCAGRSLLSKEYDNLNKTFERALEKLPKMPRLWLMYCSFLNKQNLISKTRAVYNWSFRNLPLTQHDKIWQKYAKWCMSLDNTSTALNAIPRYLKINPDFKQIYADYLYEKKLYSKCLKVLQDIVDDEGYSSKARMTKQDFYLRIVDIVTDFPEQCNDVDGSQIIKYAIEKYEDKRGSLWVKLSDYYIKKGQFQKARESLEEALDSIDNVKDFGIIFSAYCKFEEEMITALADESNRKEHDVVEEDNVDYQIQARLAKLENLIQRRPYLLHKINLRRNSNNVKQWLKLASLYQKQAKIEACLNTLENALSTVKPEEVSQGKLSDIVIKIARIHKQTKDMLRMNETMFGGTQIQYKKVDDYFNIWTEWAEMLIEQKYYHDALKIVKHLLFKRKNNDHKNEEQSAQKKARNAEDLLKSHTGIWQLYIDLEISLGTFEQIKLAYERCKEQKCLTPIMLLNYTNFLWENTNFEETFRVFEYAIGHFTWPSLYQIWIAYINKFISRYGKDGIGVERTRSIFERLLKSVPQDKCLIFYFMYAEFEEEYGLYSQSIQIYDRMVNSVLAEQKYQAYNIYIAKVSKLLGITKTRAIFEVALQKLNQKQILEIGRKYADIQKKMGEIERARSIYIYICQFTNPKGDPVRLWSEWQNFESQYGDKESFKQYLRIKRSVEAKFLMLPPDIQRIQQEIKKGLV